MAHGTRTGNMLQYMLQQRHDERGAWAARTSWNCRLQKAQLNTAACSPYFGCNGPCDAPTSRMKVPSGAGSRSACGRICWQHTGRRDDGRAHACEGAHAAAAAARGTPGQSTRRSSQLPDRFEFKCIRVSIYVPTPTPTPHRKQLHGARSNTIRSISCII